MCQDPQSSFILGTAVYLQGCPVSLSPCRLLKTKTHGWLLTPSAESRGGFHYSPLQKVELGLDRRSQGRKLCAAVTSHCPRSIVTLLWNDKLLYYSFHLIPCLCFLQNLPSLPVHTFVKTGDKFYTLDIFGKFFKIKKHEQDMQGVTYILCNDSTGPSSELCCEVIHDPVTK